MAVPRRAARGGAFLLEAAETAFLPEDLSEMVVHLGEVAAAFAERAVRPRLPDLERQDRVLLRELLRQAGEVGLFAVEIPTEYGGVGLGRVAAMRVGQMLAPLGGFAVAHGAHVGIGSWPLVFFGNEAQRRRYLPKLATGEYIGAFALTEPEAGSDALHARTVAEPVDGGFRLRGEKLWITNAGVADLFTIFAEVPGQGLTAFLVERGQEGLHVGPEYRKMGIHSSSTSPVHLNGVTVAADQVLGEVGKGHRVALGVLNFGRLALAAGALGSSEHLLRLSIAHASRRRQFGRAIAEFGLIRQKLAAMAVRTFALGAAVYRAAGTIDASLEAGEEPRHVLREYAVECSVNKVFGSEVLAYVVDEAMQIHGGQGYMQESEVERAYRDARINRIFEGTNEINRLVIADTLLRRALSGELPLLASAAELSKTLFTLRKPAVFPDALDEERWHVEAAKKVALLSAGLAGERLGAELADHQEILAACADMAIWVFTAESAWLRARRRAEDAAAKAAARLFVRYAVRQIRQEAERALGAVLRGDELRLHVGVVAHLTDLAPADEIALGEQVAAQVIATRNPL